MRLHAVKVLRVHEQHNTRNDGAVPASSFQRIPKIFSAWAMRRCARLRLHVLLGCSAALHCKGAIIDSQPRNQALQGRPSDIAGAAFTTAGFSS